MKKGLIIFLILILVGCQKQYKININDIQTASYKDFKIIEEDFDKLKEEINKIDFKETKSNKKNGENLVIISKEKIHNFKISDNNIYYEEDDKNYISDSINNIKNLLEKIEKKYTDFSFFNIDYGECSSSNKDLTIKLNTANNCLIINTNEILFNFKIHSLNMIDNNLNETDLLYQKDEISQNKVIIKFLILPTPKTKISFDTKYNYTVSIIPILNEKTGNLELNSSYKKK